jgi:hypothetical protein
VVHDTVVPRTSRVGLLGLIATIALLMSAAVAALVTMPSQSAASSPPQPVAQARPAVTPSLPPHRVGDRVLQHFADAGLLGVELDRSDPALLHVVVARGSRPLDCNVIRPDVSVIAQNASAVRIVVSGWEYVPRSTALTGRGGTTCVTSGSTALPVRLTSALGLRRVYDGRSPASTTVADRG